MIVGHDQGSGLVPDVQTEVFPYLHASGALLGRAFQVPTETVAEAGGCGFAPVELTEGKESPFVGPVVAIEVVLELLPPSAVQIDDRPHVAGVHELEERPDIRHGPLAPGAQPLAEMVVGVDGRKRGLWNDMAGSPQTGARRVVPQG